MTKKLTKYVFIGAIIAESILAFAYILFGFQLSKWYISTELILVVLYQLILWEKNDGM